MRVRNVGCSVRLHPKKNCSQESNRSSLVGKCSCRPHHPEPEQVGVYILGQFNRCRVVGARPNHFGAGKCAGHGKLTLTGPLGDILDCGIIDFAGPACEYQLYRNSRLDALKSILVEPPTIASSLARTNDSAARSGTARAPTASAMTVT